jgi:peptidoglycan/xylan/chitin deacetylase (PgdA/CDA1 family)
MAGRAARIGVRALLCAGALASGAALARWTAPEPMSSSHAASAEDVQPPAPIREPDAPAASEARAAPDEPAAVAVDPPEAAFADPLASTMRDGLVVTGGTPHRLILFTFDDGPDLRYTRRLLDALDALDIRAVFFLTARRFAGTTPHERRLAALAQEIVRRGHFVGSHTMDHAQLPLLTGPALDEQVIGAEEVFERVFGGRPWLIRPPGGARSQRIDSYLARRGYTQVLWNLGTGDAQVRTSDEVLRTFERVLDRREREYGERGGIVLLHDIHEWSIEAVPRIVRLLQERNCELLRREEELYDIVDDPRVFFAARGEAAPSEPAPPVQPAPDWLRARQAALRARTEARCAQLAMR